MTILMVPDPVADSAAVDLRPTGLVHEHLP